MVYGGLLEFISTNVVTSGVLTGEEWDRYMECLSPMIFSRQFEAEIIPP